MKHFDRKNCTSCSNNPQPLRASSVTILPVYPDRFRKSSYIRFLNASPNYGNIDIFLNGKRVAADLKYRFFTDYFEISNAVQNIVVYPAGEKNPIFSIRFTPEQNTVYTGVFTGNTGNFSMEFISDKIRVGSPNITYLRFADFAPDSPAFDVYLNNSLVISDINPGEVSNYMPLRPGTYSLSLVVSGTEIPIFEEPELKLDGGLYYTAHILGSVNDRTGVQVIVESEGSTTVRNA